MKQNIAPRNTRPHNNNAGRNRPRQPGTGLSQGHHHAHPSSFEGSEGRSGNNQRQQGNRNSGNYQQLFDKYMNLARDCLSAGDRVEAEFHYQHADHYLRLINERAASERTDRSREPRQNDSPQQAPVVQNIPVPNIPAPSIPAPSIPAQIEQPQDAAPKIAAPRHNRYRKKVQQPVESKQENVPTP
ncbi:MAG: DUF4167 domain-containing protein [Alphaproteobacteria bacterium]|nr:DUF4167 domain-containing protein [Alphaproteobacteria bacterium]